MMLLGFLPYLAVNCIYMAMHLGCLDGAGSQGSTSINLRDFVRNTSDIQSFVFVVGQTANKEIQGYTDDFVKVSEYELVAAYCLSRIIRVMETKWDI